MPVQRRKDLVHQRRRTQDDGDDDGSIITEAIDDSQSEASLPSEADDDADADYSDLSEHDVPGSSGSGTRPGRSNGSAKKDQADVSSIARSSQAPKRASSEPLSFETTKETEAMMNGLKISQDDSKAEALSFDSLEKTSSDPTQEASSETRPETLSERRRREHEEYKKKRDSDPAFIPTRGSFFMHDQRNSSPAGNGFRGQRGGRGRGRGGAPAPFAPAGPSSFSNEPMANQWSHDLHESLLEAKPKHIAPANAPSGPSNAVAGASQPAVQSTIRSFSTTQVLGKLQLRVFLPSMKYPITYSDVTVKRYTKLPTHRPPLRRDKPVRISLPEHPVRYIFPSMERSFIFIPRALRPNQQGFGRGRGKGAGSFGGFSSRRTSIYGGSMYSPSVAMSRRSSIARDGMASPAGSILGRPVVRLPPGAHHQHTASGTPIHSAGISTTGTPAFGLPQGPASMVQKPHRENWPSNLQMHQPRPQKTISVTGIENPVAGMNFQGPTSEQPPFHHQIPQPINGVPTPQEPPGFPHNRQQSYSQSTAGTPLSNIPERAIHAQPFQPFQQTGYPQYAGQTPYYYPSGNPAAGQFTPMYIQPQQQGGFMMPAMAAPAPPGPAPAPTQPNASTAASAGMVAHEQNGMVYYYDPNQMYVPQEGYPQTGYVMSGMGSMLNPGSEGYYYPQVPPGPVFYPQ